jgi:RNA polymerase sigma-70 factor (ECF subfamily)
MPRNNFEDRPVSPVSAEKPADGVGLDLGEVLQKLRPELVRFAWWLARDRALAEDVVQEAMLRAWRSQADLRDVTSARAWMLTIVRREHARLYERKRLEMTNLDEAIESEDSSLSTHDDAELVELRLAIFRLPSTYREPLALQVLGGFSTEEIARELELTQATVLTRLFRARDRLRELYGVGVSS